MEAGVSDDRDFIVVTRDDQRWEIHDKEKVQSCQDTKEKLGS
jgi:hypothetical protein